jgi:hypothetical protein
MLQILAIQETIKPIFKIYFFVFYHHQRIELLETFFWKFYQEIM